ncbi:hypothetical protein EOD39_14277 [Acipenser ruthenus]|uniref:OCA domain-containing protein n=1 Tax=Acipenser ruthenus TaxID=7906 RepID=A0A444UGD3_ACIRT|nr:hypothetical protein EOD39_14277 [Acipenser ruthenus]
MSGINKTKVYQGVRVKTTVKELLQQRRALQAAERATQIYQSTDNSVQFPSHTSFAAPYYTAPANTAETNCFQPGQYTDNFSYEQMVSNALENQQIMDMLMEPDNYTASALYPMPIAQHGSYGNYQQGADHYNSAMAPSSISDSSNVSSPVDYSSYSPPQSYSSASSSYGSPTHVDPRHYAPYYTAPANTAETNCFQPGQYTDNFSYEQMVSNALENQQIMDMLMQPDNYTASALYPMPIAQHGSYGNYQQGADHYNSAMAPSSISDSSNVSSPVDYSSYSPPQSYSSASSSYGSPTHVDPRHYGSIPEDCHSHHCTLPYGCCLSQAPSPQAHMNQLPEYIPYSTSDCLYSSAMTEESFIRREPNNWDMCYL